jgi:hypothetical protein
MRATLLLVICICGLACLFALASVPAETSEKPEPVILQATAHSPPVPQAETAALTQRLNNKFESATNFARGQKHRPELSPPPARKITLHNKDEPVLRE